VEQFFGFVGGIVGLAAYVPYIQDIRRRKTRPDRASWFIWSIEYAALFAAQWASGARSSLWIIGLQCLGVFTVSALSVRSGAGSFTWRTVLLLAGVCATLGLW